VKMALDWGRIVFLWFGVSETTAECKYAGAIASKSESFTLHLVRPPHWRADSAAIRLRRRLETDSRILRSSVRAQTDAVAERWRRPHDSLGICRVSWQPGRFSRIGQRYVGLDYVEIRETTSNSALPAAFEKMIMLMHILGAVSSSDPGSRVDGGVLRARLGCSNRF
jgi:hypothetical protein